jgi:hypothetical protein
LGAERAAACADNVSAAWPVLDYDLLADRARQLLGDNAADDVGAAARHLRGDEPDGPVRPGLRLRCPLQPDLQQ